MQQVTPVPTHSSSDNHARGPLALLADTAQIRLPHVGLWKGLWANL